MAQIVCPSVSAEDRARLEAVAADRNRAQKHAARAQIILGSADRLSVAEVARRAGVGRPAVWRWQRRFAEAGVEGLLRDAARKPGKAPLGDQTVRRIVTLTCAEPPGEATHWTSRAMARHSGVSLRAVQRIWAAHDLQPHRIRTFKRSTDPAFPEELEDILGLYVAPRHQEFLRFLNTIERAVPAGKVIHVILDNYGSHKHPKVLKWLARHPRWVFHFTPTSGSWLNAVETFFSALTRRRLRRGAFRSVFDLQAALNRYIAEHNEHPTPFIWSKTANQILAKLNPQNASVH
jgi:transposase